MAPENGHHFGIAFPRDLRAAALSPAATTVAARAGLAAPTVPCGCGAMFELPRCSVLCRAVRAVPFQLDPHGSTNLGNPLAVHGSLVAQTAVVVVQRSSQASGGGVFHLLPSWMFVPASGKFHTPGPWAFGA